MSSCSAKASCWPRPPSGPDRMFPAISLRRDRSLLHSGERCVIASSSSGSRTRQIWWPWWVRRSSCGSRGPAWVGLVPLPFGALTQLPGAGRPGLLPLLRLWQARGCLHMDHGAGGLDLSRSSGAAGQGCRHRTAQGRGNDPPPKWTWKPGFGSAMDVAQAFYEKKLRKFQGADYLKGAGHFGGLYPGSAVLALRRMPGRPW